MRPCIISVLQITARASTTLTNSTFDEDVKDFHHSLTTATSQHLAGFDTSMPIKFGMGTKSVTRMAKKRKGDSVAVLRLLCCCCLL
jgi:hypothetical protein